MKIRTLMIHTVLVLGTSVAHAAGKTCKLEIAGNDAMQYDKKELTVPAGCTDVELTLKHSGTLAAQTMGHTWVLSKTADMTALTTAAISAGAAKGYVPVDKRVLASTKLIGGGQSTTTKFVTSALKKGEDYSFFCTFPGHAALMKGKFIVQ